MGEGDCIVEKPAVAPYCRSGLTNPVGRNGRRRYRWYSERRPNGSEGVPRI